MNNACYINAGWWPEQKLDIIIKIVAFMINPVLGFGISLLRINTKSSFVIIYLSFLSFGLSFSVDAHFLRNKADFFLDGMYHRADFEQICNFSLDELGLYLLVGNDGGIVKDIYDKVVKFLVSRFTDNYHFFYLFISSVFSFFLLKSLHYLTQENTFKRGPFFLVVVYLFCSMGIFSINGVRFGTGLWVAIYSIFKIYIEKKHKYYFLLLLTPLVHASFWILIALIIICNILKRTGRIKQDKLMLSFAASFFLGSFFSLFIRFFLVFVPEPFSSWALFYMNADEGSDGSGVFFDIFDNLKLIHMAALEYVIIKNARQICADKRVHEFFLLACVLIVFVNVSIGISNLGGRFVSVILPIIMYLWTVFFSNKKYQALIYMAPLVYFYDYVYFMPRLYLKVLEVDFFYKSPLLLINQYLFNQ